MRFITEADADITSEKIYNEESRRAGTGVTTSVSDVMIGGIPGFEIRYIDDTDGDSGCVTFANLAEGRLIGVQYNDLQNHNTPMNDLCGKGMQVTIAVLTKLLTD